MAGVKNKIGDLTNILFEELERLNDEELSDEELQKEIDRAKAITQVSSQIQQAGTLALNAQKLKLEYGMQAEMNMPMLLEG